MQYGRKKTSTTRRGKKKEQEERKADDCVGEKEREDEEGTWECPVSSTQLS